MTPADTPPSIDIDKLNALEKHLKQKIASGQSIHLDDQAIERLVQLTRAPNLSFFRNVSTQEKE